MRRLRIFEQLLIVFFITLLPLCAVAVIIININQHAVRAELKYSASVTADNLYQKIVNTIEEKKVAILYVAKGLQYISSHSQKTKYLKEILKSNTALTHIDLLSTDENILKQKTKFDFENSNIQIFHRIEGNTLYLYAKISNFEYVKETIDLTRLNKIISVVNADDKRQVYVINSTKQIIMSHNSEPDNYKRLSSSFPLNSKAQEPVFFGPLKNQPNIFLKMSEPDWRIVVLTPKHLTRITILKARYKIILVLIVAALIMLACTALYAFSLYTNIRQLLRAIAAIAGGNYKKRIRLIKRIFTPHEVVYIAQEFNKMAQRIENSYYEIQKVNKELSKLDEMKSNLIDTVSHEFRTPLTCIKGYTSTLLRNDVNLNEETRIKSLKVIKQQTERLRRMVDDMLVIPDLESSKITMLPDEINLKETIEDCILSIQQKQMRIINFSLSEDIQSVWADRDRLEQIVINLLDNAIKYSPKESEIAINAYKSGNNVNISIHNQCKPIDKDVLDTLFNKFTRIEDNLTRTTRGTGLGLYISKGLIEAMGGNVSISADDGFKVIFTLPVKQDSDENEAKINAKSVNS